MKSPWIENYAGTWLDDEGRTLIIAIEQGGLKKGLQLNELFLSRHSHRTDVTL